MYVYVLTQCIARRIPEQCKTFKQHDGGGDLSAQITHLEHTLDMGLARLSERVDKLSASMGHAEKRLAEDAADRQNKQPRTNAKLYMTTDSDSEDPPGPPPFQNSALCSAIGNLPGKTLGSYSDPTLPFQMQDLLNSQSISTAVEDTLLKALCPKEWAEKLLAVFFKRLNIQRYPIPKNVVTEAFETFYDGKAVIHETNLSRYSLLSAVLAVCTLYVHVTHPETIAEFQLDEQLYDLELSRRLVAAAELSCSSAQSVGREDTFSVLTYTTLTRYFFVSGNISRSWASLIQSVRVAHSLGLHRDGQVFGFDAEECERRRTVWALLFSASQNYCLGFGRPPLIMEAFCDTRPPKAETPLSAVPAHLRDLFKTCPPPSPYRILNYRMGFSRFVARLSCELHNVSRPASYSRILELHTGFESYVKELPFYFQLRLEHNRVVVDDQCDAEFPFLKLQRCHLWLDLLFFTLALHCPYLLRMAGKNSSVGRYSVSYEACLTAVEMSLALRRQLLNNDVALVPSATERDVLAGFRWFNTIVVAGVLLLIASQSNDVERLRAYLHEFIEHREKQRGQGRDAEVEKDISTVRAFLTHAATQTSADAQDDVVSLSSSNSTHTASEDHNASSFPDAALMPDRSASYPLLGLRESFPSGDQPLSMTLNQQAASTPTFPWNAMGGAGPTAPTAPASLPDLLGAVGQGLPFSADGMADLASNTYGPALNLGGMYRLPSMQPSDGLSPQTMMPIWPMNAGRMPSNSQAFPVDYTHQNQDTQELLSFW